MCCIYECKYVYVCMFMCIYTKWIENVVATNILETIDITHEQKILSLDFVVYKLFTLF